MFSSKTHKRQLSTIGRPPKARSPISHLAKLLGSQRIIHVFYINLTASCKNKFLSVGRNERIRAVANFSHFLFFNIELPYHRGSTLHHVRRIMRLRSPHLRSVSFDEKKRSLVLPPFQMSDVDTVIFIKIGQNFRFILRGYRVSNIPHALYILHPNDFITGWRYRQIG